MGRLSLGIASLALASACVLPGCSSPDADTNSRVAAPEGARVGEAVEISEGLAVVLISEDATRPTDFVRANDDASTAAGIESSPTADWIVFEVRNSADTPATFPSRPVRPEIVDALGERLEVSDSSAELVDGGGGWGPASGALGEPYANPGGLLRTSFRVPEIETAPRPLVVTYAPRFTGAAAVFIIE